MSRTKKCIVVYYFLLHDLWYYITCYFDLSHECTLLRVIYSAFWTKINPIGPQEMFKNLLKNSSLKKTLTVTFKEVVSII